jgi:hypothetical protein
MPGASATRTVTVRNDGRDDAPAGARLALDAEGVSLSAPSDGGSVAGARATWDLPMVPAGGSVARTILIGAAGDASPGARRLTMRVTAPAQARETDPVDDVAAMPAAVGAAPTTTVVTVPGPTVEVVREVPGPTVEVVKEVPGPIREVIRTVPGGGGRVALVTAVRGRLVGRTGRRALALTLTTTAPTTVEVVVTRRAGRRTITVARTRVRVVGTAGTARLRLPATATGTLTVTAMVPQARARTAIVRVPAPVRRG